MELLLGLFLLLALITSPIWLPILLICMVLLLPIILLLAIPVLIIVFICVLFFMQVPVLAV